MRVAYVYGGQSAEHPVSIQSAITVAKALDEAGYETVPVYIDREGGWHSLEPSAGMGHRLNPSEPNPTLLEADVVFPLIHGKGGEDGSLQGLCSLLGLPFVGSGIASSAICLDKELTKRVLSASGLPVAPSITLTDITRDSYDYDSIVSRLGFPFFVKPATQGSSIGISKVAEWQQLKTALESAFSFDSKILVEGLIEGMEIEVGVIGSKRPETSPVGRVLHQGEFFGYDEKYSAGSSSQIPAHIPAETAALAQTLALAAYAATGCDGMARVDFFLKTDGSLVINEINTIPGFTESSMFPALWREAGIQLPELMRRLVEDALTR